MTINKEFITKLHDLLDGDSVKSSLAENTNMIIHALCRRFCQGKEYHKGYNEFIECVDYSLEEVREILFKPKDKREFINDLAKRYKEDDSGDDEEEIEESIEQILSAIDKLIE